MMKKRINRKGFTMVEVLIVVAIIVALAAVGFVALFSHMRKMEQLELDGQAKEIFVAAQNHLALADSQGYLGRTEFGELDETTEVTGKDVYYYIVGRGTDATSLTDKGHILELMMPFAAVEESARTGGSYIIRYQPSTATVMDVFYADPDATHGFGMTLGNNLDDGWYDKLFSGDNAYAKRADYRRDCSKGGLTSNRAVLGYYGGEAAKSLKKGEPLLAPGIQLVNADKLYVVVTDNNDPDSNNGTNKLSLTISNKASTPVQINIDLYEEEIAGASVAGRFEDADSDSTYIFVLDDVTQSDLRFSDLDDDFTPGEDITVQARAYNNSVLTNIAESSVLGSNSLFETYDPSTKTATIAYTRHLINLDGTDEGSGVDVDVVHAVQTADLSWKTFIANTDQADTAVYPPVTPVSKLVDYTGLYNDTVHKISDIAINYDGPAGLFDTLENCDVSDLVLVDFKVTGGGATGALAGQVTGNSTISGVLVRNSKTGGDDSKSLYYITGTGTGAVGGLVGILNGEDARIEDSAAAVYVTSATGPAGGLIGRLTGGATVVRSYSGGHTENARYVTLEALADSTVIEKTETNVYSSGSHAGGLIGDAANGTVKACYSTCSVASAASTDVGVGGLIGTANQVSVNTCYSVGLVEASGSAKTNAFIADFSTENTSVTNCNFLTGISASAAEVTTLANVTAAVYDQDSTLFHIPTTEAKGGAEAYDRTLMVSEGKYPFRTIDMLKAQLPLVSGAADADNTEDSKTGITNIHVGDWELANLTKLDYKFVDGNELTTSIVLKENTSFVTLALYGETSHNARVYIIDVSDQSAPEIMEETAVKCTVDSSGKITARTDAWKIKENFPNMHLSSESKTDADDGTVTYTITAVLDSITRPGGHFTQLFADGDNASAKLLPGENVTLYVGGGMGTLAQAMAFGREEDESPDKIGDFNEYGKVLNSLFAFSYEKEESADSYDYLTTLDEVFENPQTFRNATQVELIDRNIGTNLEDSDYDKNEEDEGDKKQAYRGTYGVFISNIRHLQNLDTSTSNVNTLGTDVQKVQGATLCNNIVWPTPTGAEKFEDASDEEKAFFYQTIYAKDAVSTAGTKIVDRKFNGIYNAKLRIFNGNNYTITNMTVGATYGTGNHNAGFVRLSDNDLTIQNLRLQNPRITAVQDDSTHGGVAGAFVAEVTAGTTKLITVLVDAPLTYGEGEKKKTYEVNGETAAGGLVGKSGTSGSVTIENSASNMLITSEGPAGGIVGEQSGSGTTQISNSYVGGHTYDGLYYVDDDDRADTDGVDPDGPRWNIISTGNAAGGILGLLGANAKAKIEYCFNAATVYADNLDGSEAAKAAGGVIGVASGTILSSGSSQLDMVYVVAPVYNVQEILETESGTDYTYTTQAGYSGSIVGTTANALIGSTTDQHGFFYLPDVYSDPFPMVLNNGKFNIKPSGEGSTTNVKFASYYESDDQDNSFLGVDSDFAFIEQETKPKDTALGSYEYPFAIWTKFKFDSPETKFADHKRYYYGDWQPMPSISTIHLCVHFAILDPTDGELKPVDSAYEEVIYGIQIPYRKTKFTVNNYPKEIFGYNYGTDWGLYRGKWISGSAMPNDALKLEDVNRALLESRGNYYTLMPKIFKEINREEDYRSKDSLNNDIAYNGGDPYIHVTFILPYTEITDSLFVLDFQDQVFGDDGKPADPKAWAPAETEVVQVAMDDDDSVSLTNLLMDGDNLRLPTYYKDGYRLDAWYYKDGETFKKIAANTYDSDEEKFTLELDKTVTDLITFGGEGEDKIDVANLEFHAEYHQVFRRKLDIKFVYMLDDVKTDIPNVPSISIPFDSDKGLDKVVNLPGNLVNKSELWPLSFVDASFAYLAEVTEEDPKNYDFAQTLDVHPWAHFVVPDQASSASDITCEILYQVQGAAKSGFAVVYDLWNTVDDNDEYKFDETDHYVVYKSKTGETDPGESPSVQKIISDIRTQLNGFVGGSGRFDIDDVDIVEKGDAWEDPYDELGIPITIKDSETGDDLPVKYLVVVTCKRVTHDLRIEYKDEADTFILAEPEPMFGQTINSLLPSEDDMDGLRGEGYEFGGWWYDDTHEVGPNAKMPDKDLTVEAHWTGKPSPFTVMFVLQNADDNEYTTFYWDESTDLMADEGTVITLESGTDGITVKYTKNKETQTKPYTKEDLARQILAPNPKDETLKEWAMIVEKHVHVSEDANVDVVAKGDGSTVFKVYLDRNIYRLRFDVGFSKYSNSSWGYRERTDAYSDDDVVYGHDSSGYFRLTKVGDDWVYQSNKVRNPYNDQRYKVTTGNELPQYGVVDHTVVPLRGGESYTKTEDYYYSRYTGTNNGTYYIPSNGDFTTKELYYNGGKWYGARKWNRGQGKWQYSDEYGGDVYSRTSQNGNQNQPFTDTANIYYLNSSGQFTTTVQNTTPYGRVSSGGTYRYYKLTHSNSWVYGNNNTPYGNGIRYTAVENDSVNTDHNLGFVDGSMREIYKDDQGWYYETEGTGTPTTTIYRGILYVEGVASGTETFYISSITNAYNYNDFLTSSSSQMITQADPFAGYHAYDRQIITGSGFSRVENHYTVYYMDVIQRYGGKIEDQWPDTTLSGYGTGYTFVGWIQSNTSWIYDDQVANSSAHRPASIKGKYETMSDKFILNYGDGNGNYLAVTIDDPVPTGFDVKPGVAQEFHCRYTNSARTYVYRQYFYDPAEDEEVLHAEIVVTPGSGSNPDDQTAGTFVGYKLDYETVTYKSNNQLKTEAPGSQSGNYSIQLTDPANIAKHGATVNGLLREYHYVPAECQVYVWDKEKNSLFATDDYYEGYYGQSLKLTKTGSTYKLNDGTVLPTGNIPTSHEFLGWFDNPHPDTGDTPIIDANGNPTSIRKLNGQTVEYTMPEGRLVLYPVSVPLPSKITFTLDIPDYEQPEESGEAEGDTGGDTGDDTGDDADDPNDAEARWPGSTAADPDVDDREFEIPYNWSFQDYLNDEEKNTAGYAWTDFTPIRDGWTFDGWYYTLVEDDEEEGEGTGEGTEEPEEPTEWPFKSGQQINAPIEIHPHWKLEEDTTRTVIVYYNLADGKPVDADHASDTYQVDLNEKKWYAPLVSDEINSNYTISPSFINAKISDNNPNIKLNAKTGNYEITFLYTPKSSDWTYTIEYRGLLTLNGQPSVTKDFLLKTESDKPGESDYMYESFYTLPEDLEGFQVKRIELYYGAGDERNETTQEHGILIEKDDNVKVTVYLVADESGFEPREHSYEYNGQQQGIKSRNLDTDLLPDTSILDTAGLTYTTTYEYYIGNQTTSVAGDSKTQKEPVNAGIYRVQIKVLVQADGKEYVFWQTPDYKSSSQPGLLYTITRCNVILISEDITNVFKDTTTNQQLLAAGTLATLVEDPRLAAAARSQESSNFVRYDDSSVSDTIKAILNVDSEGNYKLMGALNLSLSADAFRSTKSTSLTDYTPNAFTCSIKTSSGLDQNNFNFYKVYGKIYFWESRENYKSVNSD